MIDKLALFNWMVYGLQFHYLKRPQILRYYWPEMGIERLPWRQKRFNDLIEGRLDLLDGMAANITAPTLVLWGKQARMLEEAWSL
jgi:pimeloyl-ACP methyl ester carboxylesterase